MAKQFVTTNGVLRRPGAYSTYTVQSSPNGLATTGVLMLVGEADGGAHWSAETDIEENAFGPDSLAEVVAKYQSGPLVDAFKGAIAASADPDIIGSFSRAILVKTNTGTKASASLTDLDTVGTYAVMYDKNYGTKGNQIQMAVSSAQAEVAPTTGSFTYIPVVGTASINCNLAIRTNGGAAQTLTVPQAQTPTAFVAALNGLVNLTATGGVDRSVLTVSGTVALAATGNNIVLTRSIAWATTPTAGDTLVINSTAPALLADPTGGTTEDNVGAYVVTAATSTTISATKLSAAGRTGSTPTTNPIVAPVSTAAPVTIAATTDLVVYSPVTIVGLNNLDNTAAIQGAGKALEISNTDSAASSTVQLASAMLFSLATTTPVSWISTAAAPVLLTSSAESKATLTAARTDDAISESWTAGGEIPLKVGYTGGACTLTITDTLLTTSLGLSLTLSNYATIKALADFINAQAGYAAAVGTAALGFQPPTSLDRVSAIGISSQNGTVLPGRIKMDAFRLFTAVSEGSQLLQFNNPVARPAAGLPAVASVTYLSGAVKGGTTSANVTSAIAALENVQGNFLVPIFSRDASLDIVDGDTDAASTYLIADINAAAKTHVLAMSQFKKRKSRQALISIQDAFQAQQDTASNTATFRCCMVFENVKDLDSQGNIVTFQPWMAAVKAAAMQSAGFYRPITNKLINISGIGHVAGDFNPKSDTHMEAALTAGLMPIKPHRTGGWSWESDQTTYGQDDNFVFNSLGTIYTADTIALTTAQRMETAFVGKSTADISAQLALAYLDQIMADMLRLKLLTPSDDALRGYKDAKIKISGNTMVVSASIRVSTGLDFISIEFQVQPSTQTAQ